MIEKILHFCVPHLVSPEQTTAMDVARRLHPQWQVLVWQDPIDPKEFALSEFWPHVNSGAQLADLVRIEAVFNHGGIYLDSDVILQKPLDDLADHLNFFIASENGDHATNAVFGACRYHPALGQMIDDLRKAPPDWSVMPIVTTGPGLFSQVLKWRKDITVIPRESFYPYNWNEPRTIAHPQSYGVHQWAASWHPARWQQPQAGRWDRALAAIRPKHLGGLARAHYWAWRRSISKAVGNMVPAERSYNASGHIICRTTHGHRIVLDGTDISITPEVVQQGHYEPQEERFIRQCLKGGDFFIDVGANVGVFALLAASVVGPFGRVFAYEPNPTVADLLAKSAVMNWMHERLVLRRVAVGSQAGDAELSFCSARLGDATVKTEYQGSSTFSHTVDYLSGLQSVVVPIVTLDEEFPYDIPIKFLKIDAEGYEPPVLAGAQRLIRHRCIDYIMVEAVREVAGEMWGFLMEKFHEICSFGYAPFTFDGEANLVPTNVRDIRNGCALTTRNVIFKALR